MTGVTIGGVGGRPIQNILVPNLSRLSVLHCRLLSRLSLLPAPAIPAPAARSAIPLCNSDTLTLHCTVILDQ